MSCIIENGYSLGCASIGGIEEVYIGTFSKTNKFGLDVDNVITSVTAGTPTVYAFEQNIETAGLNQNGVYSRENLTFLMETVLSVKFYGLDKDLRNTFLALSKAPLFAVVKSNAGLYYLLGKESEGRATEGMASLGVLQSDMNGATLSITWKSQNGMYLMDGALLGDEIIIANAPIS